MKTSTTFKRVGIVVAVITAIKVGVKRLHKRHSQKNLERAMRSGGNFMAEKLTTEFDPEHDIAFGETTTTTTTPSTYVHPTTDSDYALCRDADVLPRTMSFANFVELQASERNTYLAFARRCHDATAADFDLCRDAGVLPRWYTYQDFRSLDASRVHEYLVMAGANLSVGLAADADGIHLAHVDDLAPQIGTPDRPPLPQRERGVALGEAFLDTQPRQN